VLGAIVAELDEAVEQKTGFVYAGGQIARLEITPSSSSVEFQYMSPATGTIFGADSTGIGGRRIELDPLGAEIPKTDPYISNQRLYADLKPPGHMFINGGDPYRFDMGCSLDGLQADCSLARRLTQSGAVAQIDENGRPVDIVNLGPGLYGRATQYWLPDPDGEKLDPNLSTEPGPINGGDIIVSNTEEDDRRGHYIDGFEFLPASFFLEKPQNTGTEQPLTPGQADIVWNAKESALLKLMLYKDCKDYIGAGAFDKLAGLWNNKQIKYFHGTQFAATESPDTIAAVRGGIWANSLLKGGSYSWDSTDRIVLGYLAFQPNVGGLTTAYKLDAEKALAFVLLHELKHIMSQTGHTKGAPDSDPNSNATWNQNIYDKCFKAK
jgi:hypothetical protein